MSFGKGTTVNTAQPTQAQIDQINATTGFLTGSVIPAYKQAVQGATDVYNKSATGVTNAAQNLATTAGQAQDVLGSTGQSALQTGITGLENVFDPTYTQNQINSALAPAQAQYQQNIAAQGAQFGGAGQIGSARQALAGQSLAGTNQMNQAQLAAQVQQGIAQQQLQAGSTLAQLGQGGLGQAIGAAGQGVAASMTPQQLYNQYSSVLFGTPASSYTGQFGGTQSSTSSSSKLGITPTFTVG
jgi:hypothetical protein